MYVFEVLDAYSFKEKMFPNSNVSGTYGEGIEAATPIAIIALGAVSAI